MDYKTSRQYLHIETGKLSEEVKLGKVSNRTKAHVITLKMVLHEPGGDDLLACIEEHSEAYITETTVNPDFTHVIYAFE